jgi:hypothetical protein
VLEALVARADAGAQAQAAEARPVPPLPDRLASVAPAGAGQAPPEAPAAAVAVLEDTLRHGEVSPSTRAQRWNDTTGALLLAFSLSAQGGSLEILGRFCGIHTTTGRRGLSPLAHGTWPGAVQPRPRCCSGTVAVDATWRQSAGVGGSLGVAVDPVSGGPCHVALWPSNATPDCARVLGPRNARGSPPAVIMPAGWDAEVQAIARGFPTAQPLVCRLHARHAAWRRLRYQVPRGNARRRGADTRKALCRTPSKRPVQRRVDPLPIAAHARPAHAVVPRLLATLPQRLPAVGAPWRPTPSHAAARFLGALDRFDRAKGPWHNPTSAQKPVDLCMCGEGFETCAADAAAERQGRCPLPVAGSDGEALPWLHVRNRPHPSRWRHAIAAGDDLAA